MSYHDDYVQNFYAQEYVEAPSTTAKDIRLWEEAVEREEKFKETVRKFLKRIRLK